MSFYLVVYTAAHLIGAVSPPLDLDQCAYREDDWIERHSDRGYTFACEEHDKRPKVQIKIPTKDRRFYESYCVSNGLGCEDLPNGDRAYPGYHCYTVYRNADTSQQKIIKDTCNVAAILKETYAQCIGNGLCHVLPNGDVEFHVGGADRALTSSPKKRSPTRTPSRSNQTAHGIGSNRASRVAVQAPAHAVTSGLARLPHLTARHRRYGQGTTALSQMPPRRLSGVYPPSQ